MGFVALLFLLFICGQCFGYMLRPMTLCLTFDDGLLDHFKVVYPLLNEFGWKGAFNVPTDFVGRNAFDLADEQQEDLFLIRGKSEFMRWEDLKKMEGDGHEIYPHTCGHLNLLTLEKQGRVDDIKREVAESKKAYIEHLGHAPSFFCAPHNHVSPQILKIIHDNGMECFNVGRTNFGEGNASGGDHSIKRFLLNRKHLGYSHVDIMIHGILRENGGWRPFPDLQAFKAFLQEIRYAELCLKVRVVPYGSCHAKYRPFISEFRTLVLRGFEFVRKQAHQAYYRCRYGITEEHQWIGFA